MKFAVPSDWRAALEFDVPVLASDAAPGEPARCFVCGTDSDPLDRTELWAVKHRHPNDHAGYVRFYCLEHRPSVPEPVIPTVAARAPARAPRASRAQAAPRRPSVVDAPMRSMCPNCFVEVSATGECGMCGARVA